jgi:toxin ParE1/3/4
MDEVLLYTLVQFGERQYQQYSELIRLALADILRNPLATPAVHRPEIHRDARVFYIARRGKRARHYFLYRVIKGERIQLGRFLHDSMDLQRHLPDEFQSDES